MDRQYMVYEVKFRNELTGVYERVAIRQYQSSNPGGALAKYKSRYGLDSSNIAKEDYNTIDYDGKKVYIVTLMCFGEAVSRILVITADIELNDYGVTDLLILNDNMVCQIFSQWNKCGYDRYQKRKRQLIKYVYWNKNNKSLDDGIKEFATIYSTIQTEDIEKYNEYMRQMDKAFISVTAQNILKYGKMYKWR